MRKVGALVVAFLLIGFASALLVSYLSNTAKVDVNVDSPILVEQSYFLLDDIYGGEDIELNITLFNQADVPITGTLVSQVENVDGISCNEFTSLIVNRYINNTLNSTTDLLSGNCSSTNSTTIELFVGGITKTWLAGDKEVYEYLVSFQPNAIGTYTFTNQVLI